MTNEDRIGLLKAVAKCAPKEMGAVLRLDPALETRPEAHDHYLRFTALSGWLFLDGGREGDACFAMLDAMEGVNKGVMLSRSTTGGYMACQESWMSYIRETSYGQTRAEAVARAFVAAFTHPPESS